MPRSDVNFFKLSFSRNYDFDPSVFRSAFSRFVRGNGFVGASALNFNPFRIGKIADDNVRDRFRPAPPKGASSTENGLCSLV